MESKSQSGLTGKARETLAKIFDHVLKDEFSLSATTRHYRSRMTGPNFYSLHRLFDEHRRQLEYWVSQVAKQAMSAGFGAMFDSAETKADSGPNASTVDLPAETLVGDLIGRHEVMAQQLRGDLERLEDPMTTQLLTRLLEFHETTAWMLRMLSRLPGSGKSA